MKTTISQEVIHEFEFAEQTDITTLVIGSECRKIRFKAFSKCTNLTSVVIENSKEPLSVEFDAFKGCRSLVMVQTDRPVYFYKDVNLRRRRK